MYILSNKRNTVLYTGVTNDLVRRLYEHRISSNDHFTRRYNTSKLIYYEQYSHVLDAIQREKQLKGGSRKKKEDLIATMNPAWEDLSASII